jgi:cell division protein FtsZ
VSNSAAPDANFIFGAVIDDALGDEVRVTVIAAGLGDPRSQGGRPEAARVMPGRRGGAGHVLSNGVSLGGSTPAPPVAEPSPGPEAGYQAGPGPGEEAGLDAGLAAEGLPAGSTEPAAGESGAAGYLPGEQNGHVPAADADAPAYSNGDGPGDPGPDEAAPAEPGTQDTAGDHDGRDGTSSGYHHAPGRLDPITAARGFDPGGSRRRPVVFEEDDDLDVPDFLK